MPQRDGTTGDQPNSLHLAAMGVTGQNERDALGHTAENIRLMRQQHDRRIVGDGGKRLIEIVGADRQAIAALARRQIGDLIAEPGKPERTAVLSEGARRRSRKRKCLPPPARGG